MRRLRAVIAGAAVAALAITSVGAPTMAATTAKGSVAIVNGIPGTKIDICINGREIRSRLPYGQKTSKTLNASQKRLKVFKKDPRGCRGTLLAKKRFDVLPGENKTIVITRKSPRALVFDGLGPIFGAGSGGRVAMRHAADLGAVRFVSDIGAVYPQPITHAADQTTWRMGDQGIRSLPLILGEYVALVRVIRPLSERVVVGPRTFYLRLGNDHELILVGTRKANAKIVKIKRPAVFFP